MRAPVPRLAPLPTSASTQRPVEAVELSLGRLRLVGVALIVAVTAFDLVDNGADRSLFAALPRTAAVFAVAAALLLSYRLSARIEHSVAPGRVIVAQLALDIGAVATTIVAFDPPPGGVLWVVVGLPVLEGALRYRLTGAVAAWVAVAFLLAAAVVVRWQPGQGLEPFETMASPLALGLALGVPAGYLAERLTAELIEASQARDDAHDRAWLLAVLTVAANDLTSPDIDIDDLLATVLDAGAEFGFERVDIGVAGPTGWRTLGRRDGTTTGSDRSAGDRPACEPADSEPADSEPADSLGAPEHRLTDLGEVELLDDRALIAIARRGTETLVLRAFCATCSERPERIAALRTLSGAAVSAHRGLTQRRSLAAERTQLAHDASHDALTDLRNRTGLLTALAERRSGALLFADLDGFKAVNDVYGHDAGDEVLRVVARRLEGQTPPDAVVGRLGGDEFVVLVPDATNVGPLVERLERVVGEPIAVTDAVVRVGVSIGQVPLAAGSDRSLPAEELLRRADHAMYAVKAERRSGRPTSGSVTPPDPRSAAGSTTAVGGSSAPGP
ncbi:MAG: diguanylate cyclase [Acidimicrobiales bacterium]